VEIDRPLELGCGIVKVRMAAHLPETKRDEPELEMKQRIVAVGFGRIDEPFLEE
jgi:hypothetical protein